MREPCVSDELAVEKIASDGTRERTLFANLCEVSIDSLSLMTLHDYRKLQAAYRDFLYGEDEPAISVSTSLRSPK